MLRTPVALTRNARSGSDSHASTAVHAAQCTIASGRRCDDESRTACGVRDVERGVVDGDDVLVREQLDDLAADLAAGAGDERSLMGGALSGSHHQRLSRYHSTVSLERLVERALPAPAERGRSWRCRPSSGGRGRAGRSTYSTHLLALAEQREQLVDEHPVRRLVAGTDVVDLARRALVQHELHARAVVVDVEPVALVEAVAVQREPLAVEQVGGEERDRLLRDTGTARSCSCSA